MAKKQEKKPVVVASLYRFGYELTCVMETKEEAEKLLLKEYRKTYKDWNGCYPDKEKIEEVKEFIEYWETEFGIVEWR